MTKNPKSTCAARIMDNLAQEDQDAYACQHRMPGGQSASSADTPETFNPHATRLTLLRAYVRLACVLGGVGATHFVW